MTRITEGLVECEEPFEAFRDVGWRKNGVDREVSCFGLDEINACIVAYNMDMASRVSLEAASKSREVRKSGGEGVFEECDEVINGVWWIREEDTLLDVLAREHGEVRD
jgi:hypothetical protein